MTNFFYKNRYKFVVVLLLGVLLLGLSGCRMNAAEWYAKPYTTYAQDWIDLWQDGKGFWNALWGWPMTILSYPIAWLCAKIGTLCGNSYFWGIFFTTIIVRTCAWPIYSKQNGMSMKMQLMQPDINRIQRKYQGRQDPRSQQQMQAEMMQVYKKYKVNPLGCIVNMFIQFPIFMSMYEVVQRINATKNTVINGAVSSVASGSFALSNTKVFGIFEMDSSFMDAFSAKDYKNAIFSLVIALAFGGLTMLQQYLGQKPPKYQKQHPKPKTQKEADQAKQMKSMMYVMNIMFVFMSLSNTTLGIYWLIGAVYQIFQSQLGRKINEIQYYKLQEKNKM